MLVLQEPALPVLLVSGPGRLLFTDAVDRCVQT